MDLVILLAIITAALFATFRPPRKENKRTASIFPRRFWQHLGVMK